MAEPPTSPTTQGHSSATLARSSALMASGTLVSRLLGLLRVVVLASALGVLESPAGNAWSTANTLPNTIYVLLAGGVLNAVFVPQLTKAMARPDGGRDFIDRLITLILLALTLITVVFTAGAYLLTKLYALSWSGDQLALAVAFAYLCLPQVFFYGLYTLLGQLLNAQERFGWFMWAPAVNNVVAITGLLIFRWRYPEAQLLDPGGWTPAMIWLLAGTATLGVVAQALVLLPPVLTSGFRYRPRWGFRGVGLGSASRMAMWALAVVGVAQLGMLLSTNVLNRAFDLDPSAAAKLAYENAFLLYILPQSLIALSLITAMFTQMSRTANQGDLAGLGEQYRHGLRLLATAMVPVAGAMILLAPQVTAVLFPGNSPAETDAIAWVTMALSVGLVPYGIYSLSDRVFFALQEGRNPFRLQLVITGLSVLVILVAAIVPPRFTAIGVGLGQSLGTGAGAVIGIMMVRRRLGGVPLGDVRSTVLRAVVATIGAVLVALLVLLGSYAVLEGKLAALVTLAVGGPLYLGCYAWLAHRLGMREMSEVLAPLARRLRRLRPSRGAPAAAGDTRGEQDGLLWASPMVDATPQKEPTVHGIDTGTVLGGRYVLEELLARREDSLDYWSAHDETLDRLVAVTVLPADGEHADAAQTVLDGARRTAGVDDPRLVRVLDVGDDEQHCWVVEEGLTEARSLASLVADGPLPPEEARRIVGEAASGLESARRRGLHHLYLNPHAVLRSRDGGVKISGVAVAAAIEQAEEVSPTESSLIDTADLVALIYTGLTGRWPGEELDGLRPARRLADGSLPAPSEVVSGVPGDLDALCRMTFGAEFDLSRGPQSPGELARQISPWPHDVVREDGEHRTLDAPVSPTGAGGALAGAAGAGAAVSAAHPAGEEDTLVVDRSYYRTERAASDDRTAATEAPAQAGATGHGGTEQAWSTGAAEGSTARTNPTTRDDGPGRGQTALVMFVVLAVLAVAGVLAYGAIRGLGDTFTAESDQRPLPGEPSEEAAATSDAEDTGNESPTTSAPPADQAGGAPTIRSITTYDPQLDGDENNDLVGLAVDGDEGTAWESHTYLSPGWGGLKTGVGLQLDLGEAAPVSAVELDFPEGDYDLRVYVGDEPNRDDMTQVAESDDAEGEFSAELDEPVTGRYVIVWFDRAWAGPDGEVVRVSEVRVR